MFWPRTKGMTNQSSSSDVPAVAPETVVAPESRTPRMLGCWRPAGDTNLAPEPLGAHRRAEIGVEQLKGDGIAGTVVGEVDGRHRAVTEFALDAVVAGEGGLELFEMIRSQRYHRSEDAWEEYLAPGAASECHGGGVAGGAAQPSGSKGNKRVTGACTHCQAPGRGAASPRTRNSLQSGAGVPVFSQLARSCPVAQEIR